MQRPIAGPPFPYGDAVTSLVADGPADPPDPDGAAAAASAARVAWHAHVRRLASFDVSTAAEDLIVQIDAAVDDLMDELGIPDEDDEEGMAAGVNRILALAVSRLESAAAPAASEGPLQRPGPLQPTRDPALEVTDPEQLAAMLASAAGAADMDEARDRLAALRAAGGVTAAVKPDGTVEPAAWHAYLCVEGIRTDEGRELTAGSCQTPDLPVSLRLLIEDEGGHWGCVTCGRIDIMERQEVEPFNRIYAEGVFGSDDNGQLGELLVREQTQRFVSVDLRDTEGQIIYTTVETYDIDSPVYEDEPAVDCWLQITKCTIGAATIVAMPAYPQAVITLSDVPLPDAPVATASAPAGLTADGSDDDAGSLAAAAAPVRPPKEWFADPEFHVGDPRLVLQEDGRSYACPLTVTEDGRVFGHIAWWNCRHTGFANRKVNPPRSTTGYSYFRTGPGVACADGWVANVGQITMGCGHADANSGWQAAVAHYDGGYGAMQVADVVCGQDDFGPWIAGALKPGLTDEQVRDFRALSLSGDWREAPVANGGTNLELVAVLAVPVPGFPVKRSLAAAGAADVTWLPRAGVNGDRMVSLVAAGRVVRMSPEQRLDRLERLCEQQGAMLAVLSAREKQRIKARLAV